MKSTAEFLKMKERHEKIVMLTAYDYPSAMLAENADIDMILVGDSLGMVVLGYDSTVNVTLEDMIHHGKATRRGAKDTFVVIDMPFGSYHGDVGDTLKNAVRLFQETGANALKLEGAGHIIEAIKTLISAGIPIVGHLGLQPQSAAVLGGYKVQGKTTEAAEKLINDALALQEAGVCAIVLECVPHQLAGIVAEKLTIPIIGIGAGQEVDGQVLVFHDTLSYGSHHVPKFVQTFADIGKEATQGIAAYRDAVKQGKFPAPEHQFSMSEETLSQLYGGIKR
ncbi:3-methyl-2-oxobutanoate hydroxymethyltransferase [Rummeliibacillus suwonensis]|uniref:3-methyl-2-oxobutanoate hydroxymethyltransferase n=1 Tax=Rummeliibacillus suwonensis TaxID=1306154 RepID=UPI001AAE8E75|nr:3-methyl-2-oxobutanoate hydroxymethyltransferase [Rummeliibacillus suwonensis]MBO2534772.1 3-methyl-2-oxobutanoate hydroxymethyltransferase [Rummeliibacillus suwonensis]